MIARLLSLINYKKLIRADLWGFVICFETLSEDMLFIFFFHFQPGKGQASDLLGTSVFYTQSTLPPPPTERPASRRDAATLTEAVANGKRAGILGPGHRCRRRWKHHSLNVPYISEEEPSTDGEDELINRMRQDNPEPERKEGRRAREHRKKRCNFSPQCDFDVFSSLSFRL